MLHSNVDYENFFQNKYSHKNIKDKKIILWTLSQGSLIENEHIIIKKLLSI